MRSTSRCQSVSEGYEFAAGIGVLGHEERLGAVGTVGVDQCGVFLAAHHVEGLAGGVHMPVGGEAYLRLAAFPFLVVMMMTPLDAREP